jgi:hypothetical protein
MPHRIDIDGLHKNLFILQNLFFGSELFCKAYKLHRQNEREPEDFFYYMGWLKSLVCEILIDSSIKIRIMQDFLSEHEDSINFDEIDKKVTAHLRIGKIINSNSELSIRKACNKIIHALDINLQWSEVVISHKDEQINQIEFWNGGVDLEGKQNGKQWKAIIQTKDLCLAMEGLLKYLEENIDWYHIYKYDE